MFRNDSEGGNRSPMGYLKRKLATLLKAPETSLPASSSVASRAFHGDSIYQELVASICSRLKISSFVETGTYLGDTTEFMAKAVSFPIHTCEVKESLFDSSAERLRRYAHVSALHESSDKFIRRVIDRDILGALPLFYLDAHWYDYWPLLDEVELITSKISRCVLIIDDFQVPGRNDYSFCAGGGGSAEFSGRTTIDGRICNFDLIQAKLSLPSEYELLYPKYQYHQAFGKSQTDGLVGYVAIFKNLDAEFKYLTRMQFIKSNYNVVDVE